MNETMRAYDRSLNRRRRIARVVTVVGVAFLWIVFSMVGSIGG